MKPRCVLCIPLVLSVSACNLDLGSGSAGLFEPLSDAMNNLQRQIERGLADPLDSDPYPLLVGGDDVRVFYATNLGDIRLNFKGATNDVVIPGFMGPSNLYEHRDGQRKLIRPLIPSGAFGGLASDGDWIAYVWDFDLEDSDSPLQIVVGQAGAALDDSVVFEEDVSAPSYERLSAGGLMLDENRLAYLVYRTEVLQGDVADAQTVLRIHDLTFGPPGTVQDLELGLIAASFALRGNALAYASISGERDSIRLMLHNLDSGETKVILEEARTVGYDDVMLLALNSLVWSQPTSGGLSRVSRYDLVTGQLSVWADSVQGRLTGATDEFFITEERVENFPDEANRIVMRQYNAEGSAKKLADFRADGLAGHSLVLGNRAAWVNPDRQIVLAPLSGGDRKVFKPF